MVLPKKRKAATDANSQPPAKHPRILSSAARLTVAETEPECSPFVSAIATSSSEAENTSVDHETQSASPETLSPGEPEELGPQGPETRNCNALNEAVPAEGNVTSIAQSENAVTIESNDIFTQILNGNDTLSTLEKYVVESHHKVCLLRKGLDNNCTSFTFPSPEYRIFLETLIGYIYDDTRERISTKMESVLVESFFAKYNIDQLIQATEEEDEISFIKEEVRGAACNNYRAVIYVIMKSTAYKAAGSEFRRALRDILLAERFSNRSKALCGSSPRYKLRSGVRQRPLMANLTPEGVTRLAKLIQEHAMESGPLKDAAHKMAALMKSPASTERLEKWVRELHDLLVGKSQRTESGVGRIVGTFHQVAATVVDWICGRSVGAENALPNSTM